MILFRRGSRASATPLSADLPLACRYAVVRVGDKTPIFTLKYPKGETPVTWKEWLEDKNVPGERLPSELQCRRYSLISRYPGAYKQGSKSISAKSQFPCPVAGVKRTLPNTAPPCRSAPIGGVLFYAVAGLKTFNHWGECEYL